MSNSDNPINGAIFQQQVFSWFQKHYGAGFVKEMKIPIGSPAKGHRFDIVNQEKRIVIECKRYTWTESGNVPSAKMGFTNEAAFYLSFLSDDYKKYIVMLKSHHPRRNESLAEYYYRTNRHLLGKTEVAEYDPGQNELHVVGKNRFIKDGSYLEPIRKYLESKNLLYDSHMIEEIKNRKEGKRYSIRDHVKGMVYSMISAQTQWYRIHPNLPNIDALFFNYDPDRIIETDPNFFIQGLFEMKCGNRSTKKQMVALKGNIETLRRIEKEFGSVDAFIMSDSAGTIAQKLSKSSSPYKMKMLGEPLAWEYLRNVGIDGAKPDTHLRRFFGADRMGTGERSPATINEVNEQISALSEKTGMTRVEVDNLIWSFCADGYGEICTASPHCAVCPIKDWCNG